MIKSILLVRHAQSANNALPMSERVPDPALTSLGERQAALLAEALTKHHLPLAELYCSPFRRSLDTTVPISRTLNLCPTIHADIYEQGGCYSGHEPGEFRGEPGMCCHVLGERYPNWVIDPLIGPHGWNAGRDYETAEAVRQRARRVNHWLTNAWMPSQPEAAAVLVIHADFKRILIEELLGTNHWLGSEEPIWNTAVSLLEYRSNAWRLSVWNNTNHLPDSMRT